MKIVKLLLLLPLFVIVFGSCESVKITATQDTKADFENPKTFSMYPWDKHNDSLVSAADKNAIYDAIKKEMKARGYSYVESGGDLTISVFVILNRKTVITAYTDHYGPGYYYSPYVYGPYMPYGGYNSTTYREDSYIEGTLLIDVLNTAEKKVIWQGKAVGEVKPNVRDRSASLAKTIHKMFILYPKKPAEK